MRVRRGCQISLALLLCFVIIIGLWLYAWLFYGLPSPDDFGSYIVSDSAINYTPVSLSEIPEELRWAAIAAEDRYFHKRPNNVDPLAILRAIWLNLQHDKYLICGYSITQGLATNLMSASGEPTNDLLRYRMRKLILEILITQRYKDQILEFYLNSVHYGNGIYGVGDAAQFYYGKHVSDLDLAECAMLEYLSRFSDIPDLDSAEELEKAKQGQMHVLSLMIEERYISAEEARVAMEEPLIFVHQ
jgi:membrane carboxypeptidase/penicillin-binding protein